MKSKDFYLMTSKTRFSYLQNKRNIKLKFTKIIKYYLKKKDFNDLDHPIRLVYFVRSILDLN